MVEFLDTTDRKVNIILTGVNHVYSKNSKFKIIKIWNVFVF